MQLFSRTKAILALSLGALALGACGDDVTVPVTPPAPITLSITPPSALLNIGEAVNFAVQISGGPATGGPTLSACTSSTPTVVSAAIQGSACRVTALAAGNATVTATASTGQVAAASIAVSAPAPALSSLAVSPSAAQLAVGGSVTLVSTVQPSGRTATFTYNTSSATIASVTAAGVVTAVAPGTATITVVATGSATGFTTTEIRQAVTITVSDRAAGLTALTVQPSSITMSLGSTQPLTAAVQGPRASAVTYTYGSSAPLVANSSATGVVTAIAPGTAVITVTASSTESGAFAASAITALVPVTVTPNAQVAITNITRGGATIDISNVTDQIEADIAIQPNGQVVSEVNLWICAPAETVAACAARTNGVPAARQSFTASGTQATNVRLFVNTSEFDTPDFVTGADANTRYKNGLRTLVATLTTSPSAASTIASNSISQLNFNNPDGWTINWTAPTNRANDAANVTWYGGPSTPDALTPLATSGTGSFQVVPVIYTPDRTVVQAVLNLSTGCGSNITDRTRPFAGTYGTMARDTLAVNFLCTSATNTAGLAPTVVGGVDNNNNGYTGTTMVPAVARSIFDDFTNIANSTNAANGGVGYRQSLTYRRNYLYLPHDYAAPSIDAFDIRGGSNGLVAYEDSAWVNGAAFLAGTNPVTATGTGSLRYRISDGAVGLTSANGSQIGAGAASRNTLFSVCAQANVPASTPTAAINCTSPVATGGISATIASMNVPENATNFTNTAYFAQVAETDRLGNRATSVVYSWASSSSSATRTPTFAQFNSFTNAVISGAVFGVDLTAPVVASIANTGTINTTGAIANAVRSDVDSIFTDNNGTNATGQTLATAALFAVRFTDNRSGFPACVNATTTTGNCPNLAAVGDVNAGTFSVTRRSAPTLAVVSNDALVESIVRTDNTADGLNAATNRRLTVINAPVSGFDAAYRDFTFSIAGVGAFNRVATTNPIPSGIAPAASVDGYYTFAGTLTDRAGNSTTLPTRSVAIDNANPLITGITIPAVLTGGSTVTFGPTGTDRLEVVSGDLALQYPQLAYDNGLAATTVLGPLQPTTIRFRRVSSFSTTAALGLWHNPFVAITDNKLATPIGPGTFLGSSGLTVPIPFIQQIVTVRAANQPPTRQEIFTNLFTVGFVAPDARPNQVTAWLYDIRATSPLAFTGNGRSAALAQPLFAGQIPTPSDSLTTKNWRAPILGVGAGITTWQVVTIGGISELRAETPTSITNPPFTAVHIARQVGATEWEYIGTATYAGPLDQGGNRFWRYTLSSSAIAQGNGVTMAALANGDVIKGIGVDAAGNGLSTAAGTFGLPNAIPGTTTLTATTTPTSIDNANVPVGGTLAVTIAPSVVAGGVNYTATCVSSNPGLLTATMGLGNVCTLSAAGVVAVPTNVTVTYTLTGSGANLNSNTITSTATVSRIVP